MQIVSTAERVSENPSDNYIFQRSLVAYIEAAKRILGGHVLEAGAGTGYGIDLLASKAEKLFLVDKFKTKDIDKKHDNVQFIQSTFPPFSGVPDNGFDYVVSFQVIEHIKDDGYFLKEIHRILKPGGIAILTTPNARMSLTRNPWHIREYLPHELESLLKKYFIIKESLGVGGNEKIMAYYNKNKAKVAKIKKLDIFNFEHRLPRFLLQIPYDILNRMNRKKILNEDTAFVQSITHEDYFLTPINDNIFDLFFVVQKPH